MNDDSLWETMTPLLSCNKSQEVVNNRFVLKDFHSQETLASNFLCSGRLTLDGKTYNGQQITGRFFLNLR